MGCAAYRKGERVAFTADGIDSRSAAPCSIREAAEAAADVDTFAWVGLFDPTEDELTQIGEAFDIHPLALADAAAGQERPRMDVGSQTLTVILHPASYDDSAEIVHFGQIAILAGPDYLIGVRHGNTMRPVDIRTAMEASPEWLAQGPGAVLHAMIHKVVESYGPVIAGITDDIEEVEAEVFSDERNDPTQRIYELKREVIQFSKAVGPLVNVLRELSTLDHPLVSHELQKYFSDIGDDARLIAEQATTQRELLTSALEANMTQVGIRQNEDMRRISAWGAILAVPTLFSGVYGMNFAHMPELNFHYAYFIALAMMLGVSGALWVYFKKIGWL